MLTAMSVAAVVLIVTTVLDQRGIKLLWPEFNMLGCVFMLVMLLVWGAGCLYKRVKKQGTKTVVALGLGFVIMLVGLTLSTLVMQFGQMAMAQQFATISSQSGKKVALMRAVDMGVGTEEDFNDMQARMDVRKAAIEAETGETEEDYPRGAFGYVYAAYPKILGIFYNANADCEGMIYRGCESESKILYEWTDENTLHIYLGNYEPGDEGEIVLHY